MNLNRWMFSFAVVLPLFGLAVFSGCGPGPANAPQQEEQTQEDLDAYDQRMRETGGRG